MLSSRALTPWPQLGTVGSYVTYYGGSGTDRGTGVAVDLNLTTYLAGDTNSPDLQTQAPLQLHENGTSIRHVRGEAGDGGRTNLTGELTLGVGQTFVSAGNPATFTYTITNNGPDVAINIDIQRQFQPEHHGRAADLRVCLHRFRQLSHDGYE